MEIRSVCCFHEFVLRGRAEVPNWGRWHIKVVVVGGRYWWCEERVLQTLPPHPQADDLVGQGRPGSPPSPALWPNTKRVSSPQPWSLSPVTQTFSASPGVCGGRLQVSIQVWLTAPPLSPACAKSPKGSCVLRSPGVCKITAFNVIYHQNVCLWSNEWWLMDFGPA